jgi:hypothetical protein
MKKILLMSALLIISNILFAADPPKSEQPVKMSKTKICHAPNSTYYAKTQSFTPYKTLKECLDAGGRLPKR